MRVPEFGVLRHDGTHLPLFSLAAERPVAIIFLRHLGCIFCREQVSTMRDALPSENIVFVTMAEPRLAARFRTWLKSPHPFLCDPERRLYEAFGVGRSTAGKLFSAHVVHRALQAYRKGHRNALTFDDQLQLGGTYVIDKAGSVLAAFPAEDIGDYPSPEVLLKILRTPDPIYEASPSV